MTVEVAVAVIINTQRQVLITQRNTAQSHAGFWEFPGGKLEAGEEPTEALLREIHEEVNLHITDYQAWGEIVHTYDDKSVRLYIFGVTGFNGRARACEHQTDLRWIHINDLTSYHFPAANHKIIQLLEKHVVSLV